MCAILITGFGRFPGSPVNASGIIAARLAGRRRPALQGMRRVAHVFDVCYAAVDRDLPALIDREKPDIVVMFGVAGRSRQVRIEDRARNRIALFPDASRRRPASQTIAGGRATVRNRLPVTRLVTAGRSTGASVTRSHNAGGYLCNYIYWRALEAASKPGGPGIVIFVHVPPLKLNKRPIRPPGPAPSPRRRGIPRLEEAVRAGEAIMLAMTSLRAHLRNI